ncbi:MAG: hypothetical protein KDJ38_09030, partial [Gammaproteobacteria bacterium]|nr:hypothetical protein [Gammaproteobacteria bacterium]
VSNQAEATIVFLEGRTIETVFGGFIQIIHRVTPDNDEAKDTDAAARQIIIAFREDLRKFYPLPGRLPELPACRKSGQCGVTGGRFQALLLRDS